MRFATFSAGGQTHYGVITDDGAIALSADFPDWPTLREVIEAAGTRSDDRAARPGRPVWVDQFVWQSLLKAVAVVAGAAVLLVVALRTQHLLRLIVVAVFFALAIIPAVNYLTARWGWRRGAAVGAIYGALFVFVAFHRELASHGRAHHDDTVVVRS